MRTEWYLYLCDKCLVGFGDGLLVGGLLWWRRAGQVESDLDRVVDEPLESGEGTDHDDTWNETAPDT